MFVSVPHMVKYTIGIFFNFDKADNDYVYNFATLLKDNLNDTLTVYVEYSNEVWNKVWPQYNYCVQDAISMSKNATWAPIIAWDSNTKAFILYLLL